MLVAINGKLSGVIAVADTIKAGSVEAIERLHQTCSGGHADRG